MNDFVLSLLLMGALSTSGSLPFWMTADQYGLMPAQNGGLALIQAETQLDTTKTLQWKWGASLAGNLDAGETADFNLLVDELYGTVRWKSLSLDLGMRHDPLDFYGSSPSMGSLSVTGGHVLSSGNARTMPGYMLNLHPVAVPWTGEHVWIQGSFGDFKTLDERFVPGALVHRTKGYLVFKLSKRLDISLGIDHAALWAGNTMWGKMPVTPANYFRVLLGLPASLEGSENDRSNAIGDHRGSELLRVDWRGDGWRAALQHDAPYDDGPGMRLKNFPDGVNTLWFGFDDKSRWVSDILYEFHYTRWQSGPIFNLPALDGCDNYFNNGEYRSGWTHFGRTIGTPLFFPLGTHAGTWTGKGVVEGVENNRVRAHHFALSGRIAGKAPYKLMLTYSQNYGTYVDPYLGDSGWNKPWGSVQETPLIQFSGAFTGEVPLGRLSLTYGLFVDRGALLPDGFGMTAGLRYVLTPGRCGSCRERRAFPEGPASSSSLL